MDYEELKKQPVRKLGPWGTIVTGIILAGFGFLMAFVLGRSDMKHGMESEDWPSVEGVVTASEIANTGRPVREGDDWTYYPKVSYEYAVDAKTFRSNRINFQIGGIQSHIRLDIAKIVDQYDPGKTVTVYYKPEDPSISCLETGMRPGTAFVIGIGCLAIGCLVVVSGMIAALRASLHQ